MSTRSDIIVQREDGKWVRIYAHFDGYISGNGVILHEHFNSQERAEELVKYGDLSVLGKIIKGLIPWASGSTYSKKTYRTLPRYKDVTLYYASRTDHKEEMVTRVYDTLEEAWPPEDTWTEFTYVWAPIAGKNESGWYVGDPDDREMKLMPLAEAIELDAKGEENPIKSAIKAPWGVIGQRA